MNRRLRLSADFAPPPFLPAFRTDTLLPKVEKKPPLLRSAGQLEQLFGPQLASAKETAVISSFLLSRETLIDAAEVAHGRGARTYWLTCDARLAQMFDESTSPQRIKQDMALYQEFGLLMESAVVRVGSFHAKFLLVDPTTPNRKGWLTSANLVSAACDQNVEFVTELTWREIALLYQVTRYAFWHEANTEVMADGSLKSVPCPVQFPHPPKDAELLWTVGTKAHSLREAAFEIVESAKSSLTLCGYTWQQNHPLLMKVAKKAREGVDVRIFVRETNEAKRHPTKVLNTLLEAGAKVYSVPGLHAKFLLNEKDGLMGTANFAAKGLDDGFEIGLRLRDERLEQARAALSWMQNAATEEISFQSLIGPDDFQSGRMFQHPARPEIIYRLEERRALPTLQLVASCASKLAFEAQAELDLAESRLAQTKNPRSEWCTEEGPHVKLYREIGLSVEMSAPTVPLKLRDGKLPKEEPQLVKHAGKRWVTIPFSEGDTALMEAALALAQKEKCSVAYWDKNP
jgi:phosphatidylserine/phosphatidylglycerophosphate/cardiolipin synthase-like enzyme